MPGQFNKGKVPLHYAEVADIRISKCPTLTNNFSAVFHPGCQHFCLELCDFPKNLERKKEEERSERKKRGKNAKT